MYTHTYQKHDIVGRIVKENHRCPEMFPNVDKIFYNLNI